MWLWGGGKAVCAVVGQLLEFVIPWLALTLLQAPGAQQMLPAVSTTLQAPGSVQETMHLDGLAQLIELSVSIEVHDGFPDPHLIR